MPRVAVPAGTGGGQHGPPPRTSSGGLPAPGPQTHGRRDGREPGPAVSGSRGPLFPHCRKHLGPNFRPRPIASYEPMSPPTSDLKTKAAFPILSRVASPPTPPPASLLPSGPWGRLALAGLLPAHKDQPREACGPESRQPVFYAFPQSHAFQHHEGRGARAWPSKLLWKTG